MPDSVVITLNVIGIVVGALQGVLFARTQTRVSVVGVAVFAFVTAVGGAMIRDALMAQPSAALQVPYIVAWLCATTVAVALWQVTHHLSAVLTVLDAAYLGVWTVAGASKAIHLHYGFLPAVLLGVVTGVGGGLVRDLVAGQTPTIFRSGPLYTLAAVVGSVLFTALHHHGPASGPADAGVAVATIFVVRMLSLRYRWLVPPVDQLRHVRAAQRRREPPGASST